MNGGRMTNDEELSWSRHHIYVIKELERMAGEHRHILQKLSELHYEVKTITKSQNSLSKSQNDLNRNLNRSIHIRSSVMGALSGLVTIAAGFFFEFFHRR